MKTWCSVRNGIVNSERFAELAMTGSIEEGLGAVMAALNFANSDNPEFRIKFTEDEIRKEVLEIRKPIEIPIRKGEQLSLF